MGGDAHVAGHGQLAAAPEGAAVDGGTVTVELRSMAQQQAVSAIQQRAASRLVLSG